MVNSDHCCSGAYLKVVDRSKISTFSVGTVIIPPALLEILKGDVLFHNISDDFFLVSPNWPSFVQDRDLKAIERLIQCTQAGQDPFQLSHV